MFRSSFETFYDVKLRSWTARLPLLLNRWPVTRPLRAAERNHLKFVVVSHQHVNIFIINIVLYWIRYMFIIYTSMLSVFSSSRYLPDRPGLMKVKLHTQLRTMCHLKEHSISRPYLLHCLAIRSSLPMKWLVFDDVHLFSL